MTVPFPSTIDAYRLLFADAARLEDPSRRYHAQVVLLERGLAAAEDSPADAVLMAVAEAAVELLEAQPSEPVVLNCAAVAFRELGSLDAALALFDAVQRLDPALPGLEQNLAAVRSRRRERPGAGSVEVEMASVSHRATLVARRARPAAGLTLSLCMIVRDEEEMLPRCLGAIAPVVDEIIIVDTGSRDATIEIARSFGARVIEHEWTDSFAEARNISFDAATGDWLMFLDADQVLVSEDAERLRALTGHTWREAFYLVETSYLGETGDGFAAADNVLRVFRNRPQYRFKGRVHEQITHALPVYAPGRIQQTTVRVRHYGYLEAVRRSRAKSQRNIDLLLKQADESPPDAFLHFNLGSEYAADGDTAAALAEFERAWSMIVALGSGVDYRYAPPLVARLVEALRQSGRLDDAAALATEGLRRYPEFTDLVFAQARIAFESGAVEAARAHYRRCIALGDAPVRYRPIVGSGTYLPRVALAQLALQDGDDEVARELLAWCLERHPSFHGVVAPYLSLLLRSGVRPGAAVAEVERRVKPVTPAVRVALAETLLHGGDPAGAASQAGLVPQDDPCAPAAFHILFCALISDAKLEAAADELARARAGLSEIEGEVFGTWLTIARGGPSPSSVPVGAAAQLTAILETLLRARSFQQLELLLPVLESADLPIRQRRQLLGEIYLRHGFLASAAKEWMAVCADRPDPEALLGLARVAVANDQPQDAAVFAAGALELEPDNVAAAEILTHAQAVQPDAALSTPSERPATRETAHKCARHDTSARGRRGRSRRGPPGR